MKTVIKIYTNNNKNKFKRKYNGVNFRKNKKKKNVPTRIEWNSIFNNRVTYNSCCSCNIRFDGLTSVHSDRKGRDR